MVMTSPFEKRKREKLKLELMLLTGKEKVFGRLSEADKKRKERIIRELAVLH